MKALEKSDKDAIKLRFATALNQAHKQSTIDSWKKLAKEAGMEPSHIQKISVGLLDVSLTTTVAIANALGLSYYDLAHIYHSVTDRDIQDYREKLDAQRKHKGKSKTPLSPNKYSISNKKAKKRQPK